MKKLFSILSLLLLFVSCGQKYQMPNYFKHHEKGNVKQITIQTFQVNGNGVIPYPGNYIVIWGEVANGTSTYDKNGNILSDNNYNYIYDDAGRLISTENKDSQSYGSISQDFTYNELNEIQKWGDYTFRYNDENQICGIIEDVPAQGYFPASHREYEYNNDGQMVSCNFNYNKSIYGSEYNEDGDLKRHVQLMEYGRVQEYAVEVTARDENGNWTERRIKGTNYNGVPEEFIQKRELRYY